MERLIVSHAQETRCDTVVPGEPSVPLVGFIGDVTTKSKENSGGDWMNPAGTWVLVC